MTQADFYILNVDEQTDAGRFPCRLADKVYHSGMTLFIQTRNEQESARLDDLLWTFEQGSFLPHAKISDLKSDESGLAPAIALGVQLPTQHTYQVCINLSQQIPTNPDQFQRIAEIVYNNEEAKAAARARYRHYQGLGFEVRTHSL